MIGQKWVNKELIAQRKRQYGNNFPDISQVWNKYLQSIYPNFKFQLTVQDAITMMALMKKTRIINQLDRNQILTDIDDYNNYLWISEHYKNYLQL